MTTLTIRVQPVQLLAFAGMMLSIYLIYHAGYSAGAAGFDGSIGGLHSSGANDAPPQQQAHRDLQGQQQQQPSSSSSSPFAAYDNPLGIPQGEAEALPSIRVNEKRRTPGGTKYGGEGDKQHLGGFTEYDGHGVSPAVWRHMITKYGIKSVMDVGCGKGVSTLYFAEHGLDVLCLEGSHDAVEQTLLPDPEHQVVEHDFSRGPYWPAKTYDAVWSVEFLEHVGRNFQFNYIQAFRKAAYVFVSHSRWGGWHHVEVHERDWWIQRLEAFGFRFSEALTADIHEVVAVEKWVCSQNTQNATNIGPGGKPYNAQHVHQTMMVFVNPAVASLPQHAHLMPEPGCFDKMMPRANKDSKKTIVQRECDNKKGESEIPDSYHPLKLTPEMQERWKNKVMATIKQK